MRVLNWNISHGGGSRISAICAHLEDLRPDLIALTEFQTRNEQSLRAHLKRLGYPFIATSDPVVNRNGLLVASRWQLNHEVDHDKLEIDRERWLAVRLNELDLDVLVLHIPGTPDNKFEDGYGISGAKRKELFWEHAVNYAINHRNGRAIMLGDFNTGFRLDTEGAMFAKANYMTQLIELGFVDAWRYLHPSARDYTWYSKRKDKTTGKSEDLNGFRLDYIFVSPALQHAIVDVAILHEPRRARASDHASVVANIDLPKTSATQILRHRQLSTQTMGDEKSGARQVGKTVDWSDGPGGSEIVFKGNVRARFDLVPGSLCDMKCGLNGQGFVQYFRPTYVTAEWVGGVLKQVQVWGPQVLKDGSLGRRDLDHQWKRPVAAGGVKYSELPASVAAQLESHVIANDR